MSFTSDWGGVRPCRIPSIRPRAYSFDFPAFAVVVEPTSDDVYDGPIIVRAPGAHDRRNAHSRVGIFLRNAPALSCNDPARAVSRAAAKRIAVNTVQSDPKRARAALAPPG